MAETQLLGASDESAGRGTVPMPPLPPDALIIVPVRNTVLFPGHVLPITIGRQRSIAAAQQAVREQRQVGILMQRFDAASKSVSKNPGHAQSSKDSLHDRRLTGQFRSRRLSLHK